MSLNDFFPTLKAPAQPIPRQHLTNVEMELIDQWKNTHQWDALPTFAKAANADPHKINKWILRQVMKEKQLDKKAKYGAAYGMEDNSFSLSDLLTPARPRVDKNPSVPQTQKARGIVALQNMAIACFGLDHFPSYAAVWPSAGFSAQTLPNFPLFARPCPITPRHGFVESRLVRDFGHALNIINETILADANGEVVFMPKLTGRFSGVATNAGVTWGLSNDGVTAGKEGTFFIPAPASAEYWNAIWAQAQDDFEHREKNPVGGTSGFIQTNAYVELVEHNGSVCPVQLRDGPVQDTMKNFIPHDGFTFKYIADMYDDRLIQRNDLLYWEKYIAGLVEDYGSEVVVHLPNMPLSSHYAVHAIQAGMAVITDPKAPEMGQTLSAEPRIEFTASDYAIIAKNMAHMDTRPFIPEDSDDQKNMIKTAVGTLHACSIWEPTDPRLLFLMAQAPIVVTRALSAACAGEMRHFYGRAGPNGTPLSEPLLGPSVHHGAGRSSIYAALLKPFEGRAEACHVMTADFNHSHWNSSFGGKSWGTVSEATAVALEKIAAFLADPSDRTWKSLMMACNKAVHMAHNNGKALNKWGVPMTQIAQAPACAFMNPYAAKVALNLEDKT